MTTAAKIILILFGVFTIVGGIMGFRSGSTISLVTGGISGILLVVAGVLIQTGTVTPGLILGLVVSIALLGKFVPDLVEKRTMMPAGMVTILGTLTIIACIAALVKK